MSLIKYFLCLSITLFHSRAIFTVADFQSYLCDTNDFGSNAQNYLVNLRIHAHDLNYYGDSYENTRFCDGSIIDKRWIISAARCFINEVTEVTIMAAKDRILGFYKQIFIHPKFIKDPNFNFYNGQNDLALVKTEKPIQFNALTQPIALARFGALGSTAIVIGREHRWQGYSDLEFYIEGVAEIRQCACAPKDSFMLCGQSLTHMESAQLGAAVKTENGLIGIVSEFSPSLTGDGYYIVDISLHFDWIKKVTNKTLPGMDAE